MGKFFIICALILLGLFTIYVMNTNVASKSTEVKDSALSLSSLSPPPTRTMNLNLSPTSSLTKDNVSNETTAVIKTDRGDITIILYPTDAPNTVNNFVQKAKSGFYNNLIFHRVEDWVIQGGDPLGNGTGGGNMPVEFNSKPFVVGSLGIASSGDGKVQNDAQFFITKKDSQFLNGKYTNFGIVTKGMDVAKNIQIGDKILGITTE